MAQPTRTLNQLSGQSCSCSNESFSFQIPEFFVSQNDQGMQSHFRLRCHYIYQFKVGLYKLLQNDVLGLKWAIVKKLSRIVVVKQHSGFKNVLLGS